VIIEILNKSPFTVPEFKKKLIIRQPVVDNKIKNPGKEMETRHFSFSKFA